MVWQETVNLPTSVTIGSIPITSTNLKGDYYVNFRNIKFNQLGW
jgi:hypothetical protein